MSAPGTPSDRPIAQFTYGLISAALHRDGYLAPGALRIDADPQTNVVTGVIFKTGEGRKYRITISEEAEG